MRVNLVVSSSVAAVHLGQSLPSLTSEHLTASQSVRITKDRRSTYDTSVELRFEFRFAVSSMWACVCLSSRTYRVDVLKHLRAVLGVLQLPDVMSARSNQGT